jgi:hypothetical protein
MARQLDGVTRDLAKRGAQLDGVARPSTAARSAARSSTA